MHNTLRSRGSLLCSVLAPVCLLLCASDDRPVKESERKAALMHFDTDQVSEYVRHTA